MKPILLVIYYFLQVDQLGPLILHKIVQNSSLWGPSPHHIPQRAILINAVTNKHTQLNLGTTDKKYFTLPKQTNNFLQSNLIARTG